MSKTDRMETDKLSGLPLATFRHVAQLVKNRLTSSSGPLNIPENGPIWEDDLWDEEGHPMAEVFDDVTKKIEAWGHLFGNGRYMALVPNSGNFASCLAELLLGQMDGQDDEIARSIEKAVMSWMCDMVGYPKTADGYLTPGGSTSTVVAIATAREAKGIKSTDCSKLVAYIQPRTHFAVDKALEVAGLGGCEIHLVDIDDDHRMCPVDLEKSIQRHKEEGLIPFLVVGTIGTIEVGSVDPIHALATIAEKYDMWLHVDGAIGGFYAMCEQMKTRFHGLSLADSMILDPHKTLSQPFGCGAVLFKNGHLKDLSCRLNSADVVPFWRNPLEEKMMFRSFVVWFSTHAFGIDTFRTILDRNLELALYFYDQIRAIPQLLVLAPQLSIVVFRCREQQGANKHTELMVKMINERGRVFLAPTKMRGFTYVRVPIISFRNNLTEIKLCLEEIRSMVQEIFNVPVERTDHKTQANVAWLGELEHTITWKERIIGARYLDRVLRMVYCRILYGETETRQQNLKDLLQTVVTEQGEATHVDKLLEIASAITLAEIPRPLCRLAGSIGHFVATCLNPLSGVRKAEPGAVQLEEKIISRFAIGLGMPGDCRGVLASDIWTANILGFVAARKAKLQHADYVRAVVYTELRSQDHFKASLKVIGLGECTVRTVQTTDSGELDIDDLSRQVSKDVKNPDVLPWLVAQRVQQTWKPENVKHVAEICQMHGIWHHVDIPSGGFPRVLHNFPVKLDLGLGMVHSASVEIGESLCLPIGVAAAIIREHHYLHRAMSNFRPPEFFAHLKNQKLKRRSIELRTQSAALTEAAIDPDPVYEAMAYSFELTRPLRALPLWFTLRLLGTKACQ